MPQNSCYTYFRIIGDFNPDAVTEILGLQPNTAWKIGDARRNGKEYDFASWEYGRCDEYDVIVTNQMRKTIEPFLGKIDLLNKIRMENDVSFYLEIVPTIYAGNSNPSLSPSLEVIDFCHATRTKIDIDMYVIEADKGSL